MTLTSEEALEKTEAFDKQYEFRKFTVKAKMSPKEIKEAVMERDFEDASENSDFLWDLISYWHDERKMSDEDYLTEYVDYVLNWENDEALRDQLYKEATNGSDE